MQTKTKIFILSGIVVLFIVIGIVLNINNFSSIQKEETKKDQVSNKEESNTIQENKKPKLELTQDVVELEVGASFEYKDFIKLAEDTKGYNLKDAVKAPKEVPTDVPGEYQVTYKLELSNGKSISKNLTLKVIDPQISDIPH